MHYCYSAVHFVSMPNVIDIARLVYGRVCVMLWCPFVHLSVSVCPSCQPLQQHAAGLLLWAQWAGHIDRLLMAVHSRTASSVTFLASVGG